MAQVRTEIDWTACELIEQIPGKVSGRPIVRGTRVLPDAIVDSHDLGESMDELQEGFPPYPPRKLSGSSSLPTRSEGSRARKSAARHRTLTMRYGSF